MNDRDRPQPGAGSRAARRLAQAQADQAAAARRAERARAEAADPSLAAARRAPRAPPPFVPTPDHPKRRVVLGLLAIDRDRRFDKVARKKTWRPTYAVATQPDFPIDHLIVLHAGTPDTPAGRDIRDTANTVCGDISHDTQGRVWIEQVVLPLRDWNDLAECWSVMSEYVRNYPWKPSEEEYLVHITPGSPALHIVLYLMTESQLIPARLIQTKKADKPSADLSEDEAARVEVLGRHLITDLRRAEHAQMVGRVLEGARRSEVVLKGGIATRSPLYNVLIAQIEAAALSRRGAILLLGPTGAGKTELVKRIHALCFEQHQLAGPLQMVNCATLTGDTAKSELFGHVAGAFTGATHDRRGLLELAEGGILFLDEIGELTLEVQKMLLLALEEGRVRPVGGERDVRVSFRLIAGTNKKLAQAVKRGEFREDLLARIDLWTFRLPSLSERREDIAPNLDAQLARETEQSGRVVWMLPEARARYLAFAESPAAAWAHNFRDLVKSVTRMASRSPGGAIGLGEVDEEIARLRGAWAEIEEGAASPAAPAVDLVRHYLGERAATIDRAERARLADVLAVCLGHATAAEAARVAFDVTLRGVEARRHSQALQKYLGRFGLGFEVVKHRAP